MITTEMRAVASGLGSSPVIRLEPLKEGYFPDLGDEPGLSGAVEMAAPLEPMPSQRQFVHMAPASQTQSRVPQRVFNEVLNASYEPSIAARLAVRYNRGTPEFNEAYMRERVAQIDHAARPNPTYCAIGAASVPKSAEVPSASLPARQPEVHNPWMLNRFADLIGIFGLAMIGWLTLQVVAAAAMVWGIERALGSLWLAGMGGIAAFIVLMDWMLWQNVRGRIYTAAVRPALIVLFATCVPGIAAVGFRILTTGVFQWGTSGPPMPP